MMSGTTSLNGTKMAPPETGDGIPRSVKPQEGKPKWLPIMAIDFETMTYLSERTGEIAPLSDAPDLFIREPSSLVVATNVAELVAILEDGYGGHPDWQYRVTPMRREIRRPGARRTPVVFDTVVNYFGLRGEMRASGKSRKPGHWHYPIDPFVFSRVGLRSLTGDDPLLIRLLRWGQDLREFCQTQGIAVSPTGGGIAGQLLRHPRFYPVARRKVPRKTNEQARDHLPGNYYRLYADERTPIPRATYLDMSSAHHHVALGLAFPHADRLLRRGDWSTTDATDTTVSRGPAHWTPGTPAFRNLITKSMGLLRVRLRVPALPPTRFPLPCMETEGVRTAYIYTNEIPYIYALGCGIEGIDAAWVSFQRDQGLNRYAAWCLAELATMTPARRAWAKPVLLSSYGVLAARPKMMEMGHRQAEGGTLTELPAGKRTLMAYMKKLGVRETPVANVVQRGMVEAATRIASLQMATDMTALGHRVLSIYADAVFIEPIAALPLLPAPWKVEGELTNLRFLDAVSFESDQIRRRPGVPLDAPLSPGRGKSRAARARERARHLAEARPL